jgi:hypothetical protein
MRLPHSGLTVKQLRRQMEYALEHERYSEVRNIVGDGYVTCRNDEKNPETSVVPR